MGRSHRLRYGERRARKLCTDCGAPAPGAARCPACARHAYIRSGLHRGLPLYPPSYTVIEIATGENHGTFDNEAEVLACMAFAKLSFGQVEVISDVNPMASLTGR